MKKVLIATASTFFCLLRVTAQQFNTTADTLYVKKGDTGTYRIKIICTACAAGTSYSVLNTATGSLPASKYNDALNVASFNFPAGRTENYFYITLFPNNDNDYGNTVIYKLIDAAAPGTTIGLFHLRLEAEKHKPDLGAYRLLIGSNFDFVDGVDVKSAYYHLQVFLPKGFSSKWGFVGGLQRNRQVSSQTDTISSKLKLAASGVPYRLSSFLQNDTIYQFTQVDSPSFKRISTANVFTIYFEPTIKIFPCTNKVRPTSLYAFGHADIVFRKNIYEEQYDYINPRLISVGASKFGNYRPLPDKKRIESPAYEFYYGGGLLLHHDNKFVDIYAKVMIGSANIGPKQWYYYYGGELGIREKSLNVMIGAEYRGTSRQFNPNYLNVYLSKVFNLGKLLDFVKG